MPFCLWAVCPRALNCYKSMLENLKARKQINGSISSPHKRKCGVPQKGVYPQ